MADKKDNNKPLLPNKAPRGNYQIWVILATLAVIFGVVYMNTSAKLNVKSQDELKEMVKNGDVKEVILVKNKDIVELTLTPEALNNAKYKNDITTGPWSNGEAGPHFEVRIIDKGNFDAWFR